MIDRSGTWWRGSEAADLVEFIEAYTAGSYPAGRIERSVCRPCGGATFHLLLDDEEGVARRTCAACGDEAFIGDSAEHWDDAEVGEAACPCGEEIFDLAVGFSLRTDGDIRWLTVAARCVACGVLGAYVDWKIDYSPTDHLFAAI